MKESKSKKRKRHIVAQTPDSPVFPRLIKEYLKKFSPDIVHHIAFKPIIYGSIAARLNNIRSVLNAPVGMGFVFTSDSIKAKLIRPLIKFLLKEKGMTINGVKSLLKSNINSLDDYHSDSLKTDYHKEKIKSKSKVILEKIKNLKRYGKKN